MSNKHITPDTTVLVWKLKDPQISRVKGKRKALPVQTKIEPEESKTLRLPEFLDNRHMKVVML